MFLLLRVSEVAQSCPILCDPMDCSLPHGQADALPSEPSTSLVAQTVKPRMRETWVQSLVWEDLLEKEMATHSSILAWKIPWRKSLVGYSPWGHKESDRTERLFINTTYVASLIA